MGRLWRIRASPAGTGPDYGMTERTRTMAILQDQAAELEALRRQNAELKAKLTARNNRALSWKVSEKGAISIYGMGRFPVTLYWSQFQKLRAVWADVCAFADLAYEAGELSVKDE